MKTSTYTEFRSNLARMMDSVSQDHNPILITRGSANPAVLMSLEDYNSFMETMHLMGSSANAKRLNDAISSLRAGQGVERELIENKK